MASAMTKVMKETRIESSVEKIQNYDAKIAFDRWEKLGKTRKF